MKRGIEEVYGEQNIQTNQSVAETVRQQLLDLGISSIHINLLFYFNSDQVTQVRTQIDEILAENENADTNQGVLDYLNGLLAKAQNSKNTQTDDELSGRIINIVSHHMGVIRKYIALGFQPNSFATLMICERNNLFETLNFLKDHYSFFQEIIRYEVSLGNTAALATENYLSGLTDPNKDSFFIQLKALADQYIQHPPHAMGPRGAIIHNLAKLASDAAKSIIDDQRAKAQQEAKIKRQEQAKQQQEEIKKQEEAKRKQALEQAKQQEEKRKQQLEKKKQEEALQKQKNEQKLAQTHKQEEKKQLRTKYEAIKSGNMNPDDMQTANLLSLRSTGFDLDKILNLTHAVEIVNCAIKIMSMINTQCKVGPSTLYAALAQSPDVTSALTTIEKYSNIFKQLADKGFEDITLSELFFHKNKPHEQKFALIEANISLIIKYLDLGFSPQHMSRLLNKVFLDETLKLLNEHFDDIQRLKEIGINMRGISSKLSMIGSSANFKEVINSFDQKQTVDAANLIFGVYQKTLTRSDLQPQIVPPTHLMQPK